MPTRHRMELGLYDARGHRKYVTTAERAAFLTAAEETPREVRTLCGLLVHTGCRLSEALWLTADRVDLRADLVVFETLKKRRSGVYRAVPVAFRRRTMPHTIRALAVGAVELLCYHCGSLSRGWFCAAQTPIKDSRSTDLKHLGLPPGARR
jgi:integrase